MGHTHLGYHFPQHINFLGTTLARKSVRSELLTQGDKRGFGLHNRVPLVQLYRGDRRVFLGQLHTKHGGVPTIGVLPQQKTITLLGGDRPLSRKSMGFESETTEGNNHSCLAPRRQQTYYLGPEKLHLVSLGGQSIKGGQLEHTQQRISHRIPERWAFTPRYPPTLAQLRGMTNLRPLLEKEQ